MKGKRIYRPSFQELEAQGIRFRVPYSGIQPRMWIAKDTMAEIAKDADLVTFANTGFPAELAAYFDPRTIKIINSPERARAIFSEVQKGDWTTPYAKFKQMEVTGSTQPMQDFGPSRTSGVNYNFINVPQYIFQTIIEYGDYETAVAGTARINFVADKQRAAADVINRDANYFYIYGVQDLDIYGIINQPNYNSAVTPLPSGTGGGVLWSTKTPQQIYEDIVLVLFRALVDQTDGNVDEDSPLTLVITPGTSVYLNAQNEFGRSVITMLKDIFANLEIVRLPELDSDTLGESIFLIADQYEGNTTGELGYSEKIRAGRIVPDLSSFRQKWISSTYGAIVYYPVAVSIMRGMA